MIDKDKGRADLAKADRGLAAAEERARRQIALVNRMRQHGHDATEAEKLLEAMRASLDEWRDYRRMVAGMFSQKD